MKRPLKPVRAPNPDEQKRERRFTRRILALAVLGGLFGSCINLGLRTMGKAPQPRPPGSAPPVEMTVETAPKPPRLPGK